MTNIFYYKDIYHKDDLITKLSYYGGVLGILETVETSYNNEDNIVI